MYEKGGPCGRLFHLSRTNGSGTVRVTICPLRRIPCACCPWPLFPRSPSPLRVRTDDDYEKNRYHAPGDEFDENWDWSGVMSDLKLYYRVGRMLAMTNAWPNWNEGDEFRAVRDKSRRGR